MDVIEKGLSIPMNFCLYLYGHPWMCISASVLFLYYKYLTSTFGFFKKLGINGPKPWPVLGTLQPVIALGTVEHDKQMRKYGNVVGIFLGKRPMMMIYDLDILKQIFTKEFSNFVNRYAPPFDQYPIRKMLILLKDDDWKRVRTTLKPTFSNVKLRKMYGHLGRCADTLVVNLTQKAERAETFDFRELCGAFTMDAIASVAFGIQIDSHNDPNNEFVKMGQKSFQFTFNSIVMLVFLLFPFMVKPLVRMGLTIFPQDAADFFVRVTKAAIKDRETSTTKSETDFLQLLINAHLVGDTEESVLDEDGTGETSESPSDATQHKGGRLTEEELMAQGVLFFIAGFETTANTLSLLGYCLAINPECQEKLLKEIDDNVKDGEDIDYEAVQKLPYLDMCISETMRLYPAGLRTDRVAAEDTTINGVFIPKGMVVLIPITALHMDPESWPEPTVFNPERFTPEEKEGRNPYSFIPFGAGPRSCIGMRLGLAELKIAAVKILRNLKFVQTPETEIPLILHKVSVRGANGIKIKMEKRQRR